MLSQQNIDIKDEAIDIKSYAMYVFNEESSREKGDFIRGLGIPPYLYNKKIYIEPIKVE